MLTKKMRLSRRDAGAVFKKGTRYYSPLFTLIFFPDQKFKNTRWSVIVKKKNIPKAVDRNRIKRVTSETLRQIYARFKIPGAGLIIIDKLINKKHSSKIKKEIIFLFQKNKLT